MAKKAEPKPPPEPNPEALAAYERERQDERLNWRAVHAPQADGIRKRSRNMEDLFCRALAKGYSVTSAAWSIGVTRTTIYQWRNASLATKQEDGSYIDDFCVRWEDAHEAGVDRLEDEAVRRASEGVQKPVYQGGVMVGTTTEYSDTLLQMVMRGKRPQRYNTERHEHVGDKDNPIVTAVQIEFVKPTGKK